MLNVASRTTTHRGANDADTSYPRLRTRFGSNYGPEGSRTALEKSLANLVEGLECDVTLSADEEVFALHDPDLALLTDSVGWAEDHRADEIESVHIRDLKGDVSDQHPLRLRRSSS